MSRPNYWGNPPSYPDTPDTLSDHYKPVPLSMRLWQAVTWVALLALVGAGLSGCAPVAPVPHVECSADRTFCMSAIRDNTPGQAD